MDFTASCGTWDALEERAWVGKTMRLLDIVLGVVYPVYSRLRLDLIRNRSKTERRGRGGRWHVINNLDGEVVGVVVQKTFGHKHYGAAHTVM